ncbi:MAG: 6-phosphogluconolactonase [Clostridia bacterium]|nr:6-phosphogluconolactonase [Clostridia bacterium]
MELLKELLCDKLTIRVWNNRRSAGAAAASDGAAILKKLLTEQDHVNVIFAAAPSQDDTLSALCAQPGIDWKRVHAYHMDEYVGFDREHPQSFGRYLDNHIFGLVPFGKVCYIGRADADGETVCADYAKLLHDNPPDVVFLGIGENAHIAFNDPWVADFNDPKLVKTVPLDETCRNQQVHDGCFPTLADVPTHAYTLTIPALTSAKALICTVPCTTKAEAVYNTASKPISPDYPATIMRRHPNAVMYCDPDSGAKLL